jgi:hypothetical protein
VQGRPGEVIVASGLNASGLELLHIRQVTPGSDESPHATVLASPRGLANLRKKIEDFATKNSKKKDGSDGRPRNADLAQSIALIVEAGLRQLWRSPQDHYPNGQGQAVWEVWLDPAELDRFRAGAPPLGMVVHADKLEFPEDVVVLVTATPAELAQAVSTLEGIRALAAPTTTADFFDGLVVEEQVNWVNDLLGRTTYNHAADANYVTLLDTGVSLGHPLIQPALSGADRHAAEPAWGPEDNHGHGTQLAGLALFGDLQIPLQSGVPVTVTHRLESVKILPNAGANPYHLYGAMTRRGVNAAESNGDRRRTFALATTTGADNPHDGAPTSWSSAIDQLCAGVAGDKKFARLFAISAGNTDQNLFGNDEYLATCDLLENEIESPAHAWNAICVGAYTEKALLPVGVAGTALAPVGDLSPTSRTASWSSHWPIKPDVVLEGGNWIVSGPPPPMGHQALSMLTTTRDFPQRAFTTCGDTSGATALAARALSEIWADYPQLWPETIRALFVSSARWTAAMRSHLPAHPAKGDYTPIFQRYGYGVPDLPRARRSASNALSLIVEDTITPYRKSDKKHSPHVHNEMKIFTLPWPVKELRRLGHATVTLRVALSTLIEPNPAEASRGSKFGYASHNLRFKLKRANENEAQFLARISKAAEQAEEDNALVAENDGWDFGKNRRDVGSLQIDQLTCRASDLARRHTLAVFPVTGWWKTQKSVDPKDRVARFSLVVEIDAEELQAELYAEVSAAIAAMNAVVV